MSHTPQILSDEHRQALVMPVFQIRWKAGDGRLSDHAHLVPVEEGEKDVFPIIVFSNPSGPGVAAPTRLKYMLVKESAAGGEPIHTEPEDWGVARQADSLLLLTLEYLNGQLKTLGSPVRMTQVDFISQHPIHGFEQLHSMYQTNRAMEHGIDGEKIFLPIYLDRPDPTRTFTEEQAIRSALLRLGVLNPQAPWYPLPLLNYPTVVSSLEVLVGGSHSAYFFDDQGKLVGVKHV